MTYNVGIEAQDSKWLALHRNENQFIDPEWLQKIASEVLSNLRLSSYPDMLALPLRKALSKAYAIDVDQIYVGNGADGVLADLFHYFRKQYFQIGTSLITYKVYPYLFQRYGYEQIILQDTTKNIPDFCVIDSPNSITGEEFPISEFNPPFLIWDNVYGEYAPNALNLKNLPKNRIIIRSFSKFFAMASLRLGYCFAAPEIVHELLKRKDIFNVNGFSQEMAIRLLEEKATFDSQLPQLWEARDLLKTELIKMGFIVSNSKANFVLVTHPMLSMEKIEKRLLNHHIAARRFEDPNLQNYLRITVPKLSQVSSFINILNSIATGIN